MAASSQLAALREMRPGSHVCWIVDDAHDYVELGAAVLADGVAANEKPVVFGPEGPARDALASSAVVVADPRVAFLGGGPLEPSLMFAMFEEQSDLARREGYRGLRLVADMDWLLPLDPTPDEVLSFELVLDRHASRLGATIVCAYRTDSFDTDVLRGAACVHPIDVGEDSPPQFKLIAGDDQSWELLGEVDIAVKGEFKTAISTAIAAGPCVVDLSGLDFVDVAGMRLLADAAVQHGTSVRVVGARPIVQRCWESTGFADVAATVELVG